MSTPRTSPSSSRCPVLGRAAPQPSDGVQRLQLKKCMRVFLIIKMQTDELVDNHAAPLAQHCQFSRGLLLEQGSIYFAKLGALSNCLDH